MGSIVSRQSSLLEPRSPPVPTPSFIDVLHEAPAVLERLPPAGLKNLSATCRSLRTLFCAQVTAITVTTSADASKLCSRKWPQLVMVVHTSGSKLKGNLSAQWECMMKLTVTTATSPFSSKTAVLVSSHRQLHDLSSQHCAALSGFADKHRHTAQNVTLWGPLSGCRIFQCLEKYNWPLLKRFNMIASPQLDVDSASRFLTHSLTHIHVADSCFDAPALFKKITEWPRLVSIQLLNNQLDANAVSAMTHAKWPFLHTLNLSFNKLGLVGVQHLVSCAWPCLGVLKLDQACIDALALQCLACGHWPRLWHLSLDGNPVNTTGISYLVQVNWPMLRQLWLPGQGLDKKAYLLLGIVKADIRQILTAQHECSCRRYSYP